MCALSAVVGLPLQSCHPPKLGLYSKTFDATSLSRPVHRRGVRTTGGVSVSYNSVLISSKNLENVLKSELPCRSTGPGKIGGRLAVACLTTAKCF